MPVRLDGSASTDPDGDALTFIWSIAERPAASSASLTNAGTERPELVPDVDGLYRIELLVSDGIATSMDEMQVLGGVTGSPPVANAGPDLQASVNTTVVLDGTASQDPDGTAITHQWQFASRPSGSTATFEDATRPQARFRADVVGIYIAQLIVSDGAFVSQPDTVTINVRVSAGTAWGNGDRFDPNELYLVSSIFPGVSCSRDVIANCSDLNTYSWGFGACEDLTYHGTIMADGRFVYPRGLKAFEFVEDPSNVGMNGTHGYPIMTAVNDNEVASWTCPASAATTMRQGTDGLWILCKLAPSTPGVWVHENGGTLFSPSSTTIAYAGAQVDAVLFLTNDRSSVIRHPSGAPDTPVTGLPTGNIFVFTERPFGTGFRVVFPGSTQLELWDIAIDGTATQVGSYNGASYGSRGGGAVDSRFRLYTYETLTREFRRSSLDGTVEVLNKAIGDEGIKLHKLSFVTGL